VTWHTPGGGVAPARAPWGGCRPARLAHLVSHSLAAVLDPELAQQDTEPVLPLPTQAVEIILAPDQQLICFGQNAEQLF